MRKIVEHIDKVKSNKILIIFHKFDGENSGFIDYIYQGIVFCYYSISLDKYFFVNNFEYVLENLEMLKKRKNKKLIWI